MSVIPVVLSGGSGTRLWPLSREKYPKQLLNLTDGEHTMLQQTLQRVKHLADPILVCNQDHRFIVAEQCSFIDLVPSAILLEPLARNTAPAIALAALQAIKSQPEAIIAVFPADHVIENQAQFNDSLTKAIALAEQDKLVTFGIVADKPETGYGYIKAGHGQTLTPSPLVTGSATKSVMGQHVQSDYFKVEQFVEKPDLATAQQYLRSGDYYWNSGMFVFKAKCILAALSKSQPQMMQCCEDALNKAKIDLDFIRVDKTSFANCPDNSIDYAVMENADDLVVVPMDAGWSDLGSWSSLWDISSKDPQNNAHIGDVIAINCTNNLVHAGHKLVTTLGLDNIVVVDTQDALLVADKGQVQQVKKLVDKLKQAQRSEHLLHREVHRPWGKYDSLDNGPRYQVKHITVKPGASLSLQMHHHRAEHWIVVSGTAIAEVGDQEQLLTENQSIYIPIGETHRLSNPGKLPLELIEVQSGSYLGEDDIVRFEDLYQRS